MLHTVYCNFRECPVSTDNESDALPTAPRRLIMDSYTSL